MTVQPIDPNPLSNQLPVEYRFLVAQGLISPRTLLNAATRSANTGRPVHTELTATGELRTDAYCRALARHLRMPYAPAEYAPFLRPGPGRQASSLPASLLLDAMHGQGKPANQSVLNGMTCTPHQLSQLAASGHSIAIAAPETLRRSYLLLYGPSYLDHATNDLERRFPGESARVLIDRPLILAITFAWATLLALNFVPTTTVTSVIMIISGLAFAGLLLPRIAALGVTFAKPEQRKRATEIKDQELPVYTLLVPLFHEGNVVATLVRSLLALDYPRSKLDIKLILEETDTATRDAISKLQLPACFDIITVPAGLPQTKPRALNFALQFAIGDFAVIYDAEDRPEPDQLKKAYDVFRHAPDSLACCQASLNIYNPHDSWWSRHFTIEYSALFDAILPAYKRLGFPMPLGGTSNHFRTRALRQIGGWDAFNVTEDADLGMRLARQGLACTTIQSTTFEEAPNSWRTWLPQRTRWMKGWMQTLIVDRRRRGTRRVSHIIGTHVIFSGQILSALIHPWTYVMIATATLMPGEAKSAVFDNDLVRFAWNLAITNLIACYLVGIALGAASAAKRGLPQLFWTCLSLPLYWLAMSLAAYRALWQLFTKPFVWEKTPHGLWRSRL